MLSPALSPLALSTHACMHECMRWTLLLSAPSLSPLMRACMRECLYWTHLPSAPSSSSCMHAAAAPAAASQAADIALTSSVTTVPPVPPKQLHAATAACYGHGRPHEGADGAADCGPALLRVQGLDPSPGGKWCSRSRPSSECKALRSSTGSTS